MIRLIHSIKCDPYRITYTVFATPKVGQIVTKNKAAKNKNLNLHIVLVK